MRAKKSNLLAVVIFCLFVSFLSGCAEPSRYIRKEVPELPKEEPKQKSDWLESFFKENDLVKQCPSCQRRYPGYQDRCPYDESELEEVFE